MKIMHIADIHIEFMSNKLEKEKSKLLREEGVSHFAEIIKEARLQKVDVVLLCGDLFDRTIVRKSTIKFVLDQIAENRDIKFFYCLGNHDHKLLFEGEIPENLTIFPTHFEKFDLGEVVIGGNSVQKYSKANFVNQIDFDEHRLNILMLHVYLVNGHFDDCLTFEVKELKNKNIDYLALGHIHKASEGKIDDRGEWVYSGIGASLSFDDNKIGYVLINVKDGKVSWERKSLKCKRTFHRISVDISDCNDFLSIKTKIQQALSNIKNSDLVQVILTGEVDEELDKKTEIIFDELSKQYFYFELKDNTKIKIDIQKIKKETLSLKSEFINLVYESNLSEQEKESCIKLGVASLRGEEVQL